jgi:SAM-dependent methyltransferase
LGCGFGALAAYVAAQGAEVTGVDSNGERLSVGRAVAAEHTLSLQFQRGKMQALELADSSYDLAVQNNSLCYLVERSDRSAALTEALRVLRPGGRLIVRNPNRWHPRDQFTGLPLIQLLPPGGADRLTALLGRPRSRVRLNSPLEAMRELRGTGFEDVQLVSPPSSPWPAFARPFARYQHLIARRRA